MYHRALPARSGRRKQSRDLTDAERSEIRQAFELFDADRTGYIYYRELKVRLSDGLPEFSKTVLAFMKPTLQTCLRALGFPCKKQDVLNLLQHAELDQSEPISYKDFEKLLKVQYLGRTFDELVDRAFKIFDVEDRGQITLRGLKRVTRDVGHDIDDDELQDMIRMFDKNGDGAIDKNEFKRILRTYDTSRDPDDSDEDDAWGN